MYFCYHLFYDSLYVIFVMFFIKVGSINLLCKIFEFVSRAVCQLMRKHSRLCDRRNLQYAPKETKKITKRQPDYKV